MLVYVIEYQVRHPTRLRSKSHHLISGDCWEYTDMAADTGVSVSNTFYQLLSPISIINLDKY